MKTCVFLLTVAFIGLQSAKGTEGEMISTLTSCKEIKAKNANSPSGIYSIRTPKTRETIRVYCEMGLNGGGYTFLSPEALSVISQADLNALFTERTAVIFRVSLTDGSQPYALLEQLDKYKTIPLFLGLNDYTGFNPPENLKTIGSPFLFLGFLPKKQVSNSDIQGLKVNGKSNSIATCNSDSSSQFTLYPDFDEKETSTRDEPGQFCTKAFSYIKLNPSGRRMPVDMYTFGEAHWGKCGCYKQTDRMTIDTKKVLGASIGIR